MGSVVAARAAAGQKQWANLQPLSRDWNTALSRNTMTVWTVTAKKNRHPNG